MNSNLPCSKFIHFGHCLLQLYLSALHDNAVLNKSSTLYFLQIQLLNNELDDMQQNFDDMCGM